MKQQQQQKNYKQIDNKLAGMNGLDITFTIYRYIIDHS